MPYTSSNQNDQLNDGPFGCIGVHLFGDVSEGGFFQSQQGLFSLDVVQLFDEFVRFQSKVGDVAISLRVDQWFGVADNEVEEDSVSRFLGPVGMFWGYTELVFSRVQRREGELANWGVFLRHNSVVVIERFVDGDFDLEVVVVLHVVIQVVVEFVDCKLADCNGVLWQFFVETFCFIGIDVEMECVCKGEQGQNDDCPHFGDHDMWLCIYIYI